MCLFVLMMVTSVLFGVTSSLRKECRNYLINTGKILKTEYVNLDSNLTKYEVGCTLNSTCFGPDANSTHLIMTTFSNWGKESSKCETKIFNETTIIHEMDLTNSSESLRCYTQTFSCMVIAADADMWVQIINIVVGIPPAPIERSDFNCIVHEGQRMTCEIQDKSSCYLKTSYVLHMHTSLPLFWFPQMQCVLNYHSKTDLFYESSDPGTCEYYDISEYFVFTLISKNFFGTTVTVHNISHDDILKPVQPQYLAVTSFNSTSVGIECRLDTKVIPIKKMLEHEFLLTSKYGKISIFKQLDTYINYDTYIYQFGELYAFTHYVLKVRIRTIPKVPRKYEDKYWSGWIETNFTTTACRPYQTPFAPPGAYSLKASQGNHATIEVYWQEVAQYQQNGPNFEYIVFAVSSFGQRFNASTTKNGMAAFQNMRTDEHYWVQIYTNNAEGPSPDASVIHIFPRKENYQPKIKSVLYENGTNYQLHWFPANDLSNLSNYTVMYCKSGGTTTCLHSYEFVVLESSVTSYEIRVNQYLTFALAANYLNYSTELSWQQCVVSSQLNASQPVFHFTDRMEHSVDIRIYASCTEQSLVQRYIVSYWPRNDITSNQSVSYESHVSVIRLDSLTSDTEYEIVVAAMDDRGNFYEKKEQFKTTRKDTSLQIGLMLVIGTGLSIMVAMTIGRRVKTMMDIKVDLPFGLIGIDEIPNTTNFSGDKVTDEVKEPGQVINRAFCETIIEDTVNDIGEPKEAANSYFFYSSKLKLTPEQIQTNKSREPAESDYYFMPTQMETES